MTKDKAEVDRLFHALGDATRRELLDELSRAPQTVSGLAARLGITLTAVGQHLQILEESALIRTEKLGRVRTCSIDAAGFDQLERWIRTHRSRWHLRLEKLGELLEQEESPGKKSSA